MMTIFAYRLRAFRGQILGWGIAMMLLALLIVSLYDTVLGQQAQFEELMKNYPPAMTAFFGDMTKIATPEGFLSLEFFSIAPIILGVFAVLAGSGLLVADEESGTLDLILAHPVGRLALFFGRLLAFILTIIAILALTWLGFIIGMGWSQLDVGWGAMALPLIALGSVLLLFGTLALALSLMLPSRRVAASVAGLLLIASYFITSLARINRSLQPFADISPLTYFQSGDAILGLNLNWTLGLLLVAALFAALALWRFERRDIRVGGESGWRTPRLRRRAAARA